ncbi:MAG: hypothetical protein BM564_00675 [Bacteroidetes bacterium MedPE-SWsnd-G2]|nr:MAG: hypothetical protein BM564_00675 [Bacteroidetes bacterium MedPE-SWsnd-G2]
MKKEHNNREISILLLFYLIVFLFNISQNAIYSYDTYGYLDAMPNRYPGYIAFLKILKFVPENYFNIITVGVQSIIGLTGVHFFFRKLSTIFRFKWYIKVLMLLLLVFPFFPPLLVANNLCSEALSYPLYLIALGLSFDLLFKSHTRYFGLLLLVLTGLSLTRGQFIITSVVIGGIYFLKHVYSLKLFHIRRVLLLLLLPLVIKGIDMEYHKLKDGIFMATPFSYVNAIAAPFYVSQASDKALFTDIEQMQLFNSCYAQLQSKGLLISEYPNSDLKEQYMVYHRNVPKICNQTIHVTALDYYYQKALALDHPPKKASALSYLHAEQNYRAMFTPLLFDNFWAWSNLYMTNMAHGFFSIVILFALIIICFYTGIQVAFKSKRKMLYPFTLSALTLANASIVAFASHSIMRYLFYNYSLILLLLIAIIYHYSNVKKL